MAEKMDGTDAGMGAEKAPFDDGRDFDEALERSRKQETIDARLEELKRRMGRR